MTESVRFNEMTLIQQVCEFYSADRAGTVYAAIQRMNPDAPASTAVYLFCTCKTDSVAAAIEDGG